MTSASPRYGVDGTGGEHPGWVEAGSASSSLLRRAVAGEPDAWTHLVKIHTSRWWPGGNYSRGLRRPYPPMAQGSEEATEVRFWGTGERQGCQPESISEQRAGEASILHLDALARA